jgi:hypothetical protein
MQTAISAPVSRLKEISDKLHKLDSNQSALIHVETLFLEALYLSREHNEELQKTELLKDLMHVKENEYKLSQDYYRSIKGKERAIRLFKHYVKKAIDKAVA